MGQPSVGLPIGPIGPIGPIVPSIGRAFALSLPMSKQNPNQQYYKIAGRGQSDGPDRADSNNPKEKQEFVATEKNARHPAVMHAKKK